MKVSPTEPFQLIYTLFEHEYLGFIFESFVIQKDSEGRLTFSHQNISSKNASEFDSGLDTNDYELIKIMDSMQPDSVSKHFNKKNVKPDDFFLKIFDKKTGNELIQNEIKRYLETRRSKIMPLLLDKMLFEMGADGEPTWKQIEIMPEAATVLFHFRRNEDNTHYFPTVKYGENKIEYQYKGGYILCNEPAFLVVEDKLYHFAKNVDGNKLKPFLNKKFIAIPKAIEENYYRKFVTQLVGSFDVYAKGFDIKTEKNKLHSTLSFSKIAEQKSAPSLFGDENKTNGEAIESKILFELSFNYGCHNFSAENTQAVSVQLDKKGDDYTFYRISRNPDNEKRVIGLLKENDLSLRHARATMETSKAFSWLNKNRANLEKWDIKLIQNGNGKNKYFLGESEISIEIKENIDWFDIHAVVKFGQFEIPFKVIRKYINQGKNEIDLPNGEIAVIPEEWFIQFKELMAFSDDDETGEGFTLQKHHISLVNELKESNSASVQLNRKLEKLSKSFQEIEDFQIPTKFKGKLRPYQKAGYNWMNFLREYKFGGCLADDMGLGKTVQTLALLQNVKEMGEEGVSLLVMPTSLIYNWEKEAEKFTPKLKILNYTGVRRVKDVSNFAKYDIVLTSYGIVRQDLELLEAFYFNYIILDESQVIKNPESNIAKAVKQLNSRSRLILTGTPIENTTLDLWSQMSFLNPGLLGGKSYFKKHFQMPIEKRQDETQSKKLFTIIKPFLLRRDKAQVATDLPEKIESTRYCTMSEEQESAYEKVKSGYRNEIMSHIETDGLGKSQFLLLQGLTKLRQIANHPKMTDPGFTGESGKLKEISYMLENAIDKKHKILVFSQFVKHLTIVSDYLKSQNIDFCYLDGGTKDREQQVNKFQNDPSIKVFLISLKAGGLGLNLTKADYVFLLDPWWNPAIEAQAIDRAHRIGQKNTVFTYRFITKNTVEEKILLLQQSKRKLASDLITNEESFVKNLSKEDIVNILS